MSTTQDPIDGLHHITAIAGPPQVNLDFYTGRLRQRLVKQTVNFDAPDVYHLYYGNHEAEPGSILTFFPYPAVRAGRAGVGMASGFGYQVAPGSLHDWAERLGPHARPAERFGTPLLQAHDPDGLQVELIADPASPGTIGGFHSVTLMLADPEPTARVLSDVFGYAQTAEESGPEGMRLRMELPGDAPGRVIDLLRPATPAQGVGAGGTIHHIAFRARDDAMQDRLREALMTLGHRVTERIDRQYFNAIYFREPGGVLFEIATDPPGFAVDEAPDALGRSLQLPPQYERQRAAIEAGLPPLKVPA